MYTYKIGSDRIAVDMGSNNPIISIPIKMWEEGLENFNGSWVKCAYTKETTDNDRILFTIYGDEQYEYSELDQKMCLYHGVKDTTADNWDLYESRLADSETNDLGYSYKETCDEDTRAWWEFHIFDDSVDNTGKRPELVFSEAFLQEL